jgi:hypothetical protein
VKVGQYNYTVFSLMNETRTESSQRGHDNEG